LKSRVDLICPPLSRGGYPAPHLQTVVLQIGGLF